MSLRLRLLAPLSVVGLALLAGGCGRSTLVDDPSNIVPDGGVSDGVGPVADILPGFWDILPGFFDGTNPHVLIALDVTPPFAKLAPQTQVMLRATGRYSDNQVADLTGSAVWQSQNEAVAVVKGGVVLAVGPGDTSVTATFGGFTGAAKISVGGATITSITVTPLTATTGVGGTIQFTAIANLSDGSTQDVTGGAVWSSTDPKIATVQMGGLAQGQSSGTATILAYVGGVFGKAVLTVNSAKLVSIDVSPTNPSLAASVKLQMSAIGTYSDGSIADLTQVAMWSSSSPMVASVFAGGVLVTMSPGQTRIVASYGGVIGGTVVTVISATLVSIAIQPSGATLVPGQQLQLQAIGTYSDGSTADVTKSVMWAASDPKVADVSNASGMQGRVTALSGGVTSIKAAIGNVAGYATITVTVAKLIGLAIKPLAPTVPSSGTVAFTAVGTYSDGSVLDVTALVAWSTDNGAIAFISNASGQNGVATGKSLGTTGVHATLDGITASTTITVSGATLVGIEVTPMSSTLVVGTKEFLVATGVYSDGTRVDITTQVVWSSDPMVATVSNVSGAQGLVTGVGVGVTKVVASLGNLVGAAVVTVTGAKLVQLVISPTTPSRPVGQQQQFVATAIYSNGTSMNVNFQSSWKSSVTSVATVNGQGSAFTLKAGTTTISATYMGLTAATTLTVTGAVLVAVEVSPINPTYSAGITQQFQATAIYSDNTSQNVTNQSSWTSSNPSVATVGNFGFQRGVVTTVSAGSASISATYMGLTGKSLVTVTKAQLVAISVFPAALTVGVGEVRQFRAAAIFSDNTSMDVTFQSTWLSSASTVAAVGDAFNNKGQLKALSPGGTTITASWGGLTGSAAVTVSKATVVSIQITPTQPSINVGTPLRFFATAIFSDNTSQDVSLQATWISSDQTVAQVSDSGFSKGVTQTLSAGTTSISASYGGLTGSTTLTVTGAKLVTIQVTPFDPTIPVGFNTQLQATGIYSDNSTMDLTNLATWISSAPSVAAVSDSQGTKGRLTPLSPGATKVTASYQSITGVTLVTVSSATLVAMKISPPSATLTKGTKLQLTALGFFSDGTTLDITTYVTWFSSTPAIASISNAGGSQGVATALSPGMVSISAVRGTVTGTASLGVM